MSDPSVRPDTAVIIPAKDEADRIAATVTAALAIPGVDLVVVVDDGSFDATGRVAKAAGARVVRHSRNRGKAAAMESGAEAVRLLDNDPPDTERPSPAPGAALRDGDEVLPGSGGVSGGAAVAGGGSDAAPGPALGEAASSDARNAGGRPPRHLLFLDADLGDTARAAARLIEPVRAGVADMTIATFVTRVKLGGHGLVVRLAREGIRRACGWEATQPLNGQRCLTRAAFEAARPLAYGFGVETGLTIDLVRKGFRVQEVEVEMAHRATGTDWRAQFHRARQLRDVALALATRDPLTVPLKSRPRTSR
ncbi:hypothetical protein Ssi03_26580 [Sphaerisporangium siamense]|uniref:Glycosyltransferase involved in cell wall biosynthesis n=1 Tax=Sphaerisporangium siamense TaxID=795645 RepID=A0A7W7G8Y4_9ACTN|nr:glycosyltransferase [Sphaerisporangium siamense]MBB4700015.1 glycosyltransferase involved in cell wall biosynthesis [Sphaerisporangium siamense]GII84668.1 hypothetical protein Ssi03_26580 [Sphaerisporangium siamense]